ncbi:MAG: protein phosphatase 2C domain-containing protein [Chloroflexota bacterium]
MTTQFQIAGGTVTGREHYRLHTNGQDAYHIVQRGETSVAVVCDGCGDRASKHSEVGAAVGARMIAHRLANVLSSEAGRFATAEEAERVLEQVRREMLGALRKLAHGMSDNPVEAISECLLFTVVGCAITGEHAVFFSLGDGMIVVNGRATRIGPYPDNAPPYLAYALLPDCRGQDDLRFTLHAHLSTEELDTFLIGSDGVNGLIDAACAGDIEAFRTDPLNYENPYAISNKLRLLNTERTEIDWQEHRKSVQRGVLPDDTTLIVGRKQ